MKLREKFRRFWTMDVHNHEGFTLVELIIVIAILAILSGVAVVGYSSYVEKASKQADITLIAEIENVLTLAGYDGEFDNGEGNYLILSVDGVKNAADIEGTNLDDVLTAAYGDDWANVLTLKYGSWGNNRLYLGLAGGNAEAVYNSTYYGVSDVLMGQVQDITNAATAILDVAGTGNNRNDMIAMFAQDDEAAGTSSFLNEVAAMYGYVDADGNGDISKVSDTELPNLLVLAVAYDITNEMYLGDSYEMSPTSELIQNFALFNGYAATEQGQAEGFDDAYNKFVNDLNEAESMEDVADAYKTLRNAANAKDSGYNTYSGAQGKTDINAFAAMMTGLTSSTIGDNATLVKGDLGNEDFFTSGVGNALFSTYISSVESFAGVDLSDPTALQEFINSMSTEGVVGIYFSYVDGAVALGNSLPVD